MLKTFRCSRWGCIFAFVAAGLMGVGALAGAGESTGAPMPRPEFRRASEAPEAEFNLEWFTRFVRPMKRELGDMPPLMAWTLPVPPNHRLYEPRFRERFEEALPKILERGFVPTVVVWEGRGGLTGPILMAKMIQDAGGEVHLEYRGLPGGEEKLYESCELWVDSPDNRAGRRENRWPCMIHADPTHAREWIRDAMKQFKSAGVNVDGMWFDFEPMPTPFGGALRAQRKDPRIAAQYPEGVLDDRRKFVTFIEQYECELFSEAMADPVHAVFPDALVGNYENVASSAEHPYLNRVDDVDLVRLDASMVTLYPDNWVLRNHFGKDPNGPANPAGRGRRCLLGRDDVAARGRHAQRSARQDHPHLRHPHGADVQQ